jgi:hypothetical protein
VLPSVIKTAVFCALAVWAYWTVVTYAAGIPGAAVPLTVGWIGAVGATAAVLRRSKRRR